MPTANNRLHRVHQRINNNDIAYIYAIVSNKNDLIRTGERRGPWDTKKLDMDGIGVLEQGLDHFDMGLKRWEMTTGP